MSSFPNPGVLGPWNEVAGDHDSCSPRTSGVNRICTGWRRGHVGFNQCSNDNAWRGRENNIKKGRNRRRGVAVVLLSTALPPTPTPTPMHTGLTVGEKLFLFSETPLENPPHTHLLKHKILTLGCARTCATHRVTQSHEESRRGVCVSAGTVLPGSHSTGYRRTSWWREGSGKKPASEGASAAPPAPTFCAGKRGLRVRGWELDPPQMPALMP